MALRRRRDGYTSARYGADIGVNKILMMLRSCMLLLQALPLRGWRATLCLIESVYARWIYYVVDICARRALLRYERYAVTRCHYY